MKLSIVIPTIAGREESLARTVAAYEALTAADFEIVVVHDKPNWPTACNVGATLATGDILHFGADDLVPYGDWLTPCLPVLEAGELPAAFVWDYVHEGADANPDDGPPGALTIYTRVPILTRQMVDAFGPWPSIIYFGDNWVSDAGRKHGWPTRRVAGYDFVHYWHPHGRLDGDPVTWEAARQEYMRLAAQFPRLPKQPEYLKRRRGEVGPATWIRRTRARVQLRGRLRRLLARR